MGSVRTHPLQSRLSLLDTDTIVMTTNLAVQIEKWTWRAGLRGLESLELIFGYIHSFIILWIFVQNDSRVKDSNSNK